MKYPNWKKKKYPLGSNNIYVRFLGNVARSQSDSQTHKMQMFPPWLNMKVIIWKLKGWLGALKYRHSGTKKDLSRIKEPQFICVPLDRSFRLAPAVQDNPEEDKQEILCSDFFKSKEKKEKLVQIWCEEENYIKQWIREILEIVEIKTLNKPLCIRAWRVGACVTLKGGVWVMSSVAT